MAEGLNPGICPKCGSVSVSRHSCYTRTLQDLPACGAAVTLKDRVGRWRCSTPGCAVRFFAGRLLGVAELRGHRTCRANGVAQCIGSLTHLKNAIDFDRLVSQLKRLKWVVYAKRPFGGPQYVLKYLARYTHRVAISSGRLLSFKDGVVTFQWRDSADGNKQKVMTLEALEFIRRFLQHALPSGFVKIRHFGFLANPCRKKTLLIARMLLSTGSPPELS